MLDSQVLSGDACFRFVVDFEFDSQLSSSGGAKGTGQVEYNSIKFAFSKQELKQNTANTAKANITLSTNWTYKYTTDADDKILKEYFDKIFNTKAADYGRNLTVEYQKAIDAFYKQEALTRLKKFVFYTTIPNIKWEVNMIYLENPSYKKDKGVIYYHSGDVLKPISNQTLSVGPQPNHDKWENFTASDGSMQIFMNHHVLLELFKDISDSKSFKFIMDDTNIPANSSFKMDIEHLGMIAPIFDHLYARDEKLSLHAHAENIDFDMLEAGYSGSFTMKFVVYLKEIAIFQYSCVVEYTLEIPYVEQKLNVKLTKWSLGEMRIIGGNYGVVDEATLRTWTLDTIHKALTKKPFSLFSEDVDFSTQFVKSKLIPVPNNGIVIAGDPISSIKNEVPKDFVSLLLNAFKRNLRRQ